MKHVSIRMGELDVSVSEIRNANLRVFPKLMLKDKEYERAQRIMDLYTPHSLPYGGLLRRCFAILSINTLPTTQTFIMRRVIGEI